MRGLFITLEGGDGAGKSTQIRNIERFFEEKGLVVTHTREPGGPPIAEKLRETFSQEKTPLLWQYLEGSLNNINSTALSKACLKGESETLNLVNSIMHCLAILVNNLAVSFFANSIVLHEFGFDEWMFEYFKKYLVTYCSEEISKRVKLSKCERELEFFGGYNVALYEQFYRQGGMIL